MIKRLNLKKLNVQELNPKELKTSNGGGAGTATFLIALIAYSFLLPKLLQAIDNWEKV